MTTDRAHTNDRRDVVIGFWLAFTSPVHHDEAEPDHAPLLEPLSCEKLASATVRHCGG